MARLFANGVKLAQVWLSEVVRPGDHVVDATAGNGYDTLFLAQLVGPTGRVYAFDIQTEALRQTARNLAERDLAGRVELIEAGHEYMETYVPAGVKAVVFNLGYRPGGDHCLTTQPESTVLALQAAARLLQPGGIITVVVYTGHPGGLAEGQSVDSWAAKLVQNQWDVVAMSFINRRHHSPYLLVVQKRGEDQVSEDQTTFKDHGDH